MASVALPLPSEPGACPPGGDAKAHREIVTGVRCQPDLPFGASLAVTSPVFASQRPRRRACTLPRRRPPGLCGARRLCRRAGPRIRSAGGMRPRVRRSAHSLIFHALLAVHQKPLHSELIVTAHERSQYGVVKKRSGTLLPSRAFSHIDAAGFSVNASLCWPSDPPARYSRAGVGAPAQRMAPTGQGPAHFDQPSIL
jgi:hypothetical protein